MADEGYEAGVLALTAEGWVIVRRRHFAEQSTAVSWMKRNTNALAKKNPSQRIRGTVLEKTDWITLDSVRVQYEQKRLANDPEFNDPDTRIFMVNDKVTASYTTLQGEYLAFIHQYTKLNGQPPAEGDMQRHFKSAPPNVHQMVVTLEKKGLISRRPGTARSIRVLLPPEQLPGEKPTGTVGSQKPEAILGHWRITQMEMWDQDFVDAEIEGYVRLDHDGSGEFQFGYVHGWIDHELTECDGRPAAEWSWKGNDEMDPASGRGSAVLQDNGTINGKLSFHQGDRSSFVAIRNGEPKPSVAKRMVATSPTKPNRPRKP